MSKACVSEQPIQSQSFDLNLFLQSGTRSQNDNCNKQREKMLEMMINVPDYVYSDNPEQWNTIRQRFTQVLDSRIDCQYDRLVIVPRAGRNYNYDFDVQVYHQLFLQRTLKVEFKYGKTLTSLPQILSLYVTNHHFQFLAHNYVDYWFDHEFQTFLDILNVSLPNRVDYKRRINTVEKTPIRLALDNLPVRLREKASKIVDNSIQKYLETIQLEHIDFDVLERRFSGQQDKIFVFCDRGVFSTEQLCSAPRLDRTRFSVRKGNTICVFDQDNKTMYQLLLRWKNHKGCSGPAWQISIKPVKAE